MTRILSTDLLIIGGGAAGCSAAVVAQKAGVKTMMIVKGTIGRSGCSIFAGNLSLLPDPARLEEWSRGQARSHFYINHANREYLKQIDSYRRNEWWPQLERKGLYVRRLEDGSLLTDGAGGTQTWAPMQGQSGRSIVDILRKEVFSLNVELVEEAMVTSLLTRNGTVVGATALNYLTGEFFAVLAKATILATGHSNYLATRATGTREQCANGYAFAYRAGAELQDLEIQLWHASDIAFPKAWMRLHIYPNPMPTTDESTRLYNSEGQMFWKLGMYGSEGAPYHFELKTLLREVKKGKAAFDGGYYASYKHLNAKAVEEYSYQAQFFRKLGYDISKEMLECGITWHMTYGGLRVNELTTETTLKGLYAAGGVVGHSGIDFACFDGKISGEQATSRCRETALVDLEEKQLREEEKRVTGLLRSEPRDGPTPPMVKEKIREIMFYEVGYIKNEDKLRSALQKLAEIRRDYVPKMRLESTSKNFNVQWADALDVYDMLAVCELSVQASILRKESRGPFYREDYPFSDNVNWLQHIVLAEKNGHLTTRLSPVDEAWVERTRVDFLEADF